MPLNEAILPEFDSEMANVRNSLESLPKGSLDWKPRPDAMTLGELASHLAAISHFADIVLSHDYLEVSDEPVHPVFKTRQEALEMFDRNATSARRAIAAATDEQFVGPWSLLKDGHLVFTLSRLAVIRAFVLNHSVRHRAHLRTYLSSNPAGESRDPVATKSSSKS